MKICMFVKNSFEYDARVTKEAKTLIAAGHDVTVVALFVPGVTPLTETTADGIAVIRVTRMQFGVDKLNAFARRMAARHAARDAQLGGSSDSSFIPGDVTGPSTATPGDELLEADSSAGKADVAPPVGSLRARLERSATRAVIDVLRFGYRVVRRFMGIQGRALKTYAINQRMIDVGLRSGADVFHSHDLNTLWVGYRCKQKTGAKLVYDSHELATERSRMGRWWKFTATRTERRWLPAADAMIVASEPWIDFNRRLHGRVPEPSVAIINVPERQPVDPVDLRAKLGLPEDQPIILYQGSIQENRGIEPALAALDHLEDGVMVIIGYGYHRPALEKMVADNGWSDRVWFTGPIPNRELIDHTAGADIGLCNIVSASISYDTTLPNKLFEYLMAGVAVVGSTGPEIARVVRETGAGVVVDAEDPRAIADGIRTLLDDLDTYKRAASAASGEYHWEREGQKLLNLYDALAADSRGF